MSAALRGEFGFDQAAAGLLTTAIFLTHAAMQIPGGRLADRLGPGRVMTVALAWIALANIAIAFSGAYWQLLFWKAVTGIGSGACFTSGARYVFAAYQGKSLQMAQGLFGAAALMGSGFVIFAVPQLLEALGWRGAFGACGGLALLALTIWVSLAPAVPTGHVAPSLSGLFSRKLLLLGMVQMASFGLVIVVGSWITSLLRTVYHMPLKTAGLLGSAVLMLGIVSRPLGGWLVPVLGIRKLLTLALGLNAMACVTLGHSESLPLTLAAIVMLGIGCGLPYAGIFNRAAMEFPGRAGAAMGLVNMVGIVMILGGAPAVGWLADLTGTFRSSFFALGGFSLVAALTVAVTMRKER